MLPKEGPVEMFEERSTGHLIIGSNDDARQVTIFIPSTSAPETTVSSRNNEIKQTRTYRKAIKNPKEVKFSDFKKNDPVLSKFKDLQEPYIEQKTYPLTRIDPDAIYIE